jgi:hypothetical protein
LPLLEVTFGIMCRAVSYFRNPGNDALSFNFMHGSKKESLGTKVGE